MHQNGKDCLVPGLHACGEVVTNAHGANRLGANSILDVAVFGKSVADNVGKISKPGDKQDDLKPVRILFLIGVRIAIFKYVLGPKK